MCVPRGGDNLAAISIHCVEQRPVTLTGCDTQASGEVINYCEQCCFKIYRRPEGSDAAHQRYTHDESHVEPVDIFVPVLFRHGLIRDMRFLRIVRFISIGL